MKSGKMYLFVVEANLLTVTNEENLKRDKEIVYSDECSSSVTRRVNKFQDKVALIHMQNDALYLHKNTFSAWYK